MPNITGRTPLLAVSAQCPDAVLLKPSWIVDERTIQIAEYCPQSPWFSVADVLHHLIWCHPDASRRADRHEAGEDGEKQARNG